jgi:alpha-beta hydrolase superfamily lysophospholipase
LRKLPQPLPGAYGESIHRTVHGEWDYNLDWKPLKGFGVYAGWVRGVHHAHRRAQRGLAIDVPILVAASTRSFRGPYRPEAQNADAVLDVNHIARYAGGLGSQVTVLRIDDGKHDLTLSGRVAREKLFAALDAWLTSTLGVPELPEPH